MCAYKQLSASQGQHCFVENCRMSQPYAAPGYGSYPYGYGAPQGYGYPPAAQGQYAYDYSSYYQQQPQGYDANYSAWYAQQQQQPPASSTPAPAGVAPPLPKEAPPPLPPGQPASGRPAYVSAAGAAAALQQQQQPGPTELPTSLQQYVARALALLGKTNETRLELRTVLRDTIAKAKKEGTMWSTDWDREPLPVLASAAQLSTAVYSGRGAQQQQQRTAVWDRLDTRDRDGQDWTPSKKRGRDAQQYSNSSGSGDDDGEEWYGSYKPRKRVELGSAGKKQQKQQQGKGKQQGKKGKQHKQRWGGDDEVWDHAEQAKHAARSARFAGQQQRSSTLAAYGWDEGADADDAGEFIAGTCTALEKGYFRLTRAPLPEEVRPQPVLAAALSRLLRMIAGHEDKYLYYNDQFKAMRQDLTVQGIKNEFTVQVYEAHARAALEYGDNAEYNQCQTQLAILYAAGLPGSHAEFGSYRLLYQSVHAAAGEGRRLLGTLRQLLGNKVGAVADSPELQHAMQVRQALASSNVARFFKLYACAPRLSRCLMDVAVKQLRWRALNTLVRAHKPGPLRLPFLTKALGFMLPPEDEQQQQADEPGSGSGGVLPMTRQLAALTVDEAGRLLPGCSERSCSGDNAPLEELPDALAACLEWCKQHGAVFDSEADLSACCLLTKECWQKLFVPADTTKVAHGDVNLDIRDFLAL
ncbi:hypothetical protein OEZ85_012045 [Tetradesmus obliquus]|uniref:SAC3/GANP/THP3 conserved domain-containing protein n=1 Tax=Tetradesmus obliquus TaxID=3088 RepID=A0ABY8TUA4_TETOB|nr:hypothetical protein OEZ85_012045 [Tetradesmus obliquus]